MTLLARHRTFLVSIFLGAVLLTGASMPRLAAAQATGGGTAPAATAPVAERKMPNKCSIYGISAQLECAAANMFAYLLFAVVELFTTFMVLMSKAFDFFVQNSVIGFGTWYQSIRVDLENLWTVFRDIANIIIVGTFVFIAINIILETSEYGRKQLVVRVIIVATLINFSLLFTRLAVDISNLFAYQFYQASIGRPAPGTPTGATQQTLADKFKEAMRLPSVADSRAKVTDDLSREWTRLGTYALAAAIQSLVFLVAGLVFAYGAFLLVLRALAIIFLFLVSGIAFASYLLPAMQRRILNPWWSNLAIVFTLAPVMMLMLWVSLRVAQAIPKPSTLGALYTTPSDQNAVGALFSYLVVLGMLYLSFRISSGIAKKAGTVAVTGKVASEGIKSARSALLFTGAGALAGAIGHGLAPALRNYRGSQALKQMDVLDKEISQKLAKASEHHAAGNMTEYNKLQKDIATLSARRASAERVSKRDFNAMDTSVMKKFAKATGIGTLGQTKKEEKGGYVKKVETRAEATKAAVASAAKPTGQQQETLLKRVREESTQGDSELNRLKNERDKAAAEVNKDGGEDTLKKRKDEIEVELTKKKDEFERKRSEAEGDLKKRESAAQQELTKSIEDLKKARTEKEGKVAGTGDEAGKERAKIKAEYEKAEEAAFKENQEKISKARMEVNTRIAGMEAEYRAERQPYEDLQRSIAEQLEMRQRPVAELEAKIKARSNQLEAEAKQYVQTHLSAKSSTYQQMVNTMIDRAAEKQTSTTGRMFNTLLGRENTEAALIAAKAKSATWKKEKGFREQFADFMKTQKSSSDSGKGDS